MRKLGTKEIKRAWQFPRVVEPAQSRTEMTDSKSLHCSLDCSAFPLWHCCCYKFHLMLKISSSLSFWAKSKLKLVPGVLVQLAPQEALVLLYRSLSTLPTPALSILTPLHPRSQAPKESQLDLAWSQPSPSLWRMRLLWILVPRDNHQGIVTRRESGSKVTKSLNVHSINPQDFVSSGKLFWSTPSVALSHDTYFSLFLSHFIIDIYLFVSLIFLPPWEKGQCLLACYLSLGIETGE